MKVFRRFLAISLVFILGSFCFAADAVVVSTSGKVEIQKGDAWIPLNSGDKISKGAIISTGFKSSAVVKFNETVFQLAPLTRITMEQLAETLQKESTSIYLDSGKIKSSVKRTANKRAEYTVRGPVATASVRGTVTTSGADGTVTCDDGGIVVYATPENAIGPQIQPEPTGDLPAEGESNPFTPSNDIAPSAPRNAQVLTKGDKTEMSSDPTQVVSPQNVAQQDGEVNSGSTQSLAAKESVTPSTTKPTNDNPTSQPSTPKTGSIKINITY